MVKTITKEDLAKLPVESYTGRIIVVQSLSEAEKALSFLAKVVVVGIDTETRPSFQKGVSHKIALMQISTEDTCFLFRLNIIGFPDCLSNFLTNPRIKKVGLSLKDDLQAIRKRSDIVPANLVDLQPFVKTYGIEDNSLQRIYGIIFGKKITKKQRLTNWEADILSESQKKYAALDAWACLKIFNELTTTNLILNNGSD